MFRQWMMQLVENACAALSNSSNHIRGQSKIWTSISGDKKSIPDLGWLSVSSFVTDGNL